MVWPSVCRPTCLVDPAGDLWVELRECLGTQCVKRPAIGCSPKEGATVVFLAKREQGSHGLCAVGRLERQLVIGLGELDCLDGGGGGLAVTVAGIGIDDLVRARRRHLLAEPPQLVTGALDQQPEQRRVAQGPLDHPYRPNTGGQAADGAAHDEAGGRTPLPNGT